MRTIYICLLSFFLSASAVHSQTSNCFQITSILVDACAPSGQEGLNEMVGFQVGPNPLNVNDMSVTWATTNISWLGTCQTAETAQKVAELNATIEACGLLLEPVNGVLPANSRVILVTSVNMDVASNSFAGLTDTTYLLFHCGTTTQGHFANFDAAGGIRTLSISFSSPAACSSSVSYQRNLLVNQNGQAGAQDGAIVFFDAQGNATYDNNGCNAPYIPLSADWNPPFNGNVCANSPPINLNSLITGNAGGTWSGEGVIGGSFFSAAGLFGAVDVSYTVSQGACSVSETNTINIIQIPDPSFTNPGLICSSAGPVQLNTLITGTPGGNFSGQGISNNILNPNGLSGSINVTYTIVVSGCPNSSSDVFNIIPTESATWIAPTDICAGDLVDLNPLITGVQGGTWSGQGVSGNTWNTSGLTGAVQLTYSIVSNGCDVNFTQSVTINEGGNSSWNAPESICSSDGQQDFNLFVTGTQGGNWSGQGITSGGVFNPSSVSGTVVISYTVGSGSCLTTQQEVIDVIQSPDAPSVIGPVDYCEGEDAAPLIASGEPGSSISWYADELLSEIIAEGEFFQPSTDESNVLWVIQSNNGCKSLPIQVNINVTPKPAAPQVAPEIAACQGQTVEVTASGTGTIGWYDNSQLTNLLSVGGTYSFTVGAFEQLFVVQTINNCVSDVAVVSIIEGNLIEASINPGGTINLCEGESVTLSSNFESGNTWTGGFNTPTLEVNTAGQYVLIVEGACNTSSDTVLVNIIELDASFTASVLEGNAPLFVSFESNSTGGQSCTWLINNITEPSLAAGSFTFITPGTYTITQRCVNGDCVDEFSLDVMVNSGDTQLEIANSFTPNGDNFNDFFKPNAIGIKELSARIFNRWGQLIYEWQGLENFWNGELNGSQAPEGVYFYVIEAKDFAGNELLRNGSITLLR
jgi:gliding motility-associated-like protein